MNLSKNLTRPRLAIALGIIAVLATLVVVLTALSTPRTIPNAATVRRGDLNASITATGKVRAKRSAKLSLPQSGIVASISKMEGDPVNAGDVILSLKADDANRRVKQAE
ncbi:MAG TPA: biotin/lipoyl-binding protein, partial [Anaerolineae bacterium]